MKITADGILGSAQKMNNQKKIDDSDLKQDRKNLKTDSVSIGKLVNSRIESMENEIKDIQTSLTKNQILSNGLDQLASALDSGRNVNDVLSKTSFEGKTILKDLVGHEVTTEAVKNRKTEIKSLLNNDINSLTKVQVELDNIIASGIAGGKKVESLMANLNDIFKGNSSNLDSITNLDADKVRKLVK